MAKSPYADLPEVLKNNLPALFKSYPNLEEASPSSWFGWSGDKIIAFNEKVCHRDMTYSVGLDEMVTAVPKTDELSLEYLRMLIRGPFCSMADLIKLDRVGSNYYLHILSLDKWPANVLYNFCIASRTPIEFGFLLSNWAKRCEAGFDPTLAFLLTYSYGWHSTEHTQGTVRDFSVHRPGHLWFDAASNWYFIINGLFTNVSKPFKTDPSYCTPCNTIWGHSDDYRRLKLMSDDEIAAFYTQPVKIYEKPPEPIKLAPKKKGGYLPPPPYAFPPLIPAANFVIQQQAPVGWPNIVGAEGPQPPPEDFDGPEDEPIPHDFFNEAFGDD